MFPLFKVAILLSLGITIGTFLNDAESVSMCVLQVQILIWAVIVIYKPSAIYHSWVLALLFIASGINLYALHNKYEKNEISDFQNFISKPTDYILRVEKIKNTANGFKLDATVLAYAGEEDNYFTSNCKIILYTKKSIQLFENEIIQSTLSLSRIEENKNPEGLDFKSIYAKQNIHFQSYLNSITSQFKGQVSIWNFKELSRLIQLSSVDKLKQALKSSPNSAIASALILGYKNDLTNDTKDVFSKTGAIHILAVSGLHVGLVYSIVLMFLYWFPKNDTANSLKLVLSLASIWFYVLLTGSGTSVTRAAFMLSFYLVGKNLQQFTSIYNLIGLAAICILIDDPTELFNISFQFSFLALISIIFFYKRILHFYHPKNYIINKIWQLISVSISAQILIFPLAIYYFHQFPTYFWLSGVIAIPLAFLILFIGIALLLISHVNFLEAPLFISKTLNLLISVLNESMSIMSELPYSTMQDIQLSQATVLLCYMSLLAFVLYLSNYSKKALLIIPFCLIINASLLLQDKKDDWNQSKIIVYHSSKKSYINVIHSGIMLPLYNNDVSERDKSYLLGGLMAKYTEDQDKAPEELGMECMNSFYLWGNHVFSINPNAIDQRSQCMIELDFIVITSESELNLIKFLEINPCKKVVLDGSIPKARKLNIIEVLKSKGQAYHDTFADGAFVYNFKFNEKRNSF